MDQLAQIRREQALKFQKEKNSSPSTSCSDCVMSCSSSSSCSSPSTVSNQKGKVICGKYFENPPTRLTMKDMDQILSVYVRIVPQKEPSLSKVIVDDDSASFFQSFLQKANFQCQRYGYLFGTIQNEDKSIRVHCIYEPKQNSTATGVSELEDEMLDEITALAKAFKLQVVGWIFSHPADRGSYALSASEVLKTALVCSKYGDHCVVVSVSQQPGTTNVVFHPYQVSSQCITIFKEGTLTPHPTSPNLIHSERLLEAVGEDKYSKTVKKETNDVDVALFTLPLPIAAHKSEIFRNRFSRINRPDYIPRLDKDAKNYFDQRSKEPFYQALSDFHFLVFLVSHGTLSVDIEIPVIAHAIQAKSDAELAKIKDKLIKCCLASKPTTNKRQLSPSSESRTSSKISGVDLEKITQIVNICQVSEEIAKQALQIAQGNVDQAISYLIG